MRLRAAAIDDALAVLELLVGQELADIGMPDHCSRICDDPEGHQLE